ncbi:MAG: winged helix-turn-helix transcriptional regulator [Candidatus Methanoperedens sp.]|nr:winged helix-turn-helix transcriptional regulator [Candidatus Methanoperedens sp.]
MEYISTPGAASSILAPSALHSGAMSFESIAETAITESNLQDKEHHPSGDMQRDDRKLQENGIIVKRIVLDQPEKVEYMLTEKGKDLRDLMTEMRAWGEMAFAA